MATSILFADDSAAARRAIRDLLIAKFGDRILYIEAMGGREALDKAIASRPDIVVLDIAMPGLNGIEAARYIAQQCPKTAVLAISSYDIESIIPRLSAGIRGFVRKDAMNSELFPAIEALLRGNTYFTRRFAATAAVLEDRGPGRGKAVGKGA